MQWKHKGKGGVFAANGGENTTAKALLQPRRPWKYNGKGGVLQVRRSPLRT